MGEVHAWAPDGPRATRALSALLDEWVAAAALRRNLARAEGAPVELARWKPGLDAEGAVGGLCRNWIHSKRDCEVGAPEKRGRGMVPGEIQFCAELEVSRE